MSDMPPLKQGSGSIWVQPGGPNNPVRFLGCYDVDDIEEPLGEPTYIMCRQPDRTYKVIGGVTAPPEPVTTSLVGLTTAARDYLERMQCAGAIYILQSSCGRLDNFGNFDRAYILEEVRKTSRTISNAAHHVDDAETTQSFAISARPPLRTAVRVGIDRITTTETLSANDIAGNTDLRCSGDCGDQIDPGKRLLIAIDSAVSPATANFLYSLDGLATSPLAAAVDPLAAGRSVQSVARFMVNRNTPRWLAASLATAGQQGSVAFSDDQGASGPR